ncbi:MAG TPA: glycosyl hydrolase family 18 protein, partial [Fimbriimonadaceae bacterium]|nr:glycosyl hydrolase family 18 protein [Fimbriimonadaceae bacterium]
MSPKPVFFDPQGTRRKRVSFWAASLGLMVAIVTTAFIVSFSVVPLLPKIKGLSDTFHRPTRLIPRLPDVGKRQAMFLASRARQELNQEIAKDRKRIEAEKAAAKKAPAGSPIVAAFYAPWQEPGITSFRANADKLTHVIPEWLHLDQRDPGQIDARAFSAEVNSHNPEFIEIARRNGVHIWPLISNMYEGVADKAIVKALLDSPDKQAELAGNLRDWLRKNQFDGLNIDFEALDTADYDRLPSFLALLQKTLREANLGLSIDLEAGNEDLRIRKLAQNVDLVIVMAYDDHYEEGPPGPIAPIQWSEQVLDKYADAVPSNELVLGVGSYAYDWPKGQKADSISYQAALKAAEGYRDEEKPSDVIALDDTSANTYFTYDDEDNVHHDVWVLDGISAFNQWKLARPLGVRGSALWALGTEDPSIWKFLNRNDIGKDPDPDALRTVEFGPDDLEFTHEGD